VGTQVWPAGVVSPSPEHRTGLIDELQGEAMNAVFEEKFGVDLKGRPTMFTVRGHCSERDGFIHTDPVTKLITDTRAHSRLLDEAPTTAESLLTSSERSLTRRAGNSRSRPFLNTVGPHISRLAGINHSPLGRSLIFAGR
jgi:hypothetical protein